MPRRIKFSIVLVLALASLFFVFFDQSKHVPALAEVNVFNVDPYDAVGSFGIQMAMFTALVSALRGFRSYATHETLDQQKILILRSEITTILSMVVTLATDAIALIRFPSIWIRSHAGQVLAAIVGGMILLTALTGWLVSRLTGQPLERGSWRNAWIICILAIILLAIYPLAWDQGIVGSILTALLGMLIFLVALWALVMMLFPKNNSRYEDLIDDLIVIYRWVRARSGATVGLLNLFEWFFNLPWIKAIILWLNPRQHRWNFVIPVAMAMGLFLALAEAIGEGVSPIPGRFVLAASVFIGIEGAGVLLGYALFADFLGLFRIG